VQWKTFDFFEVSQVNAADDDSKSFFENNEISCVCSGSENLFLGSYDGVVRILSPSFKILRTFQAHDTGSITHMKQVEGTSLLVTISVRIFWLWEVSVLNGFRKTYPMSQF
jgi:vacuolar protein sorting-associated protein 11